MGFTFSLALRSFQQKLIKKSELILLRNKVAVTLPIITEYIM